MNGGGGGQNDSQSEKKEKLNVNAVEWVPNKSSFGRPSHSRVPINNNPFGRDPVPSISEMGTEDLKSPSSTDLADGGESGINGGGGGVDDEKGPPPSLSSKVKRPNPFGQLPVRKGIEHFPKSKFKNRAGPLSNGGAGVGALSGLSAMENGFRAQMGSFGVSEMDESLGPGAGALAADTNTESGYKRDGVTGELLESEEARTYSVEQLWSARESVEATDWDDLVVEDENMEEIEQIEVHREEQRHRVQSILHELSVLMLEGGGGPPDHSHSAHTHSHHHHDGASSPMMNGGSSFVRGSAVRTNTAGKKLSGAATSNAFKVKMRYELDEAELLTKQIMGVLNRITPEKFGILCSQLMKIITELADSEEKFTTILDSVLNKASTEPVFSEQYADLCSYLANEMHTLQFEWVRSIEAEGGSNTNDSATPSSPNGSSVSDGSALSSEAKNAISKKFRKMMIMSCERRFSSQRLAVLEPLPSGLDTASIEVCNLQSF